MPDDQVVVAEPVAPPEVSQVPAPAPVAIDPNDPFSVDEARLATFAPEQRAVLDEWKKKASETIETRGKSAEEKYRAHVEKAQALDQLTRHPDFQKWWADQQSKARPGAAVNQGGNPQEFATPDEWSQAIIDASNGQPQKLQAIQAKMFSTMATPIVQQMQQKQQLLETTMEMKNLFERHPDAKDLDSIGRNGQDTNDKTPSLLEIAMYYTVDQQGKSVEDGYQLARRWADSMGKSAKQEAFGIVQGKKDAVTAGPSTAKANNQTVEVDSFEELTRKNMEALLSGQTPPRYVVRGSKK